MWVGIKRRGKKLRFKWGDNMTSGKTILIGKKDGMIYTAKLETEQEFRKDNDNYLSITGDGYDAEFFTESEGEARANGYLEDGEGWRGAVEGKQTTLGLDDWNELVLNTDGWESVIGNVEQIDNDLYTQLTTCGRLDDIYRTSEGWDDLKQTSKEMKTMREAMKQILKEFRHFTKQDKELFERVKAIFDKYPAFKIEDLKQYAEKD